MVTGVGKAPRSGARRREVVMPSCFALAIGCCPLQRSVRRMTLSRRILPLLSVIALTVSPPRQAEGAPSNGAARPPAAAMPALRDGSRDFDFELGTWKAHVARRLRPLTGSTEWVEFDGVSSVRKVWGGKAN